MGEDVVRFWQTLVLRPHLLDLDELEEGLYFFEGPSVPLVFFEGVPGGVLGALLDLQIRLCLFDDFFVYQCLCGDVIDFCCIFPEPILNDGKLDSGFGLLPPLRRVVGVTG